MRFSGSPRIDSDPPASGRRARRLALLVAVLALLSGAHSAPAAPPPGEAAVWSRIEASDWEGLKGLGREVLPVMARLYQHSIETRDVRRRVALANAFYQLGWESEEAKRALAADLATSERDLRLSVQYALGRVSGEDDVVDGLLRTLRTDPSPLFRDKAACALAYDQIHLSARGKVRLFLGLIAALDDKKLQVRAIAIQALEVHTGQRKGFEPAAPAEGRARAIEEWRRWLYEYRAQL